LYKKLRDFKMPPALVVKKADDLLFGHAVKPVHCGYDLTIGAGNVFPEINFTLASIDVNPDTWSQIRSEYQTMITEICQRAIELRCPGLMVELELLPPMTMNPGWGAELTEIIKSTLEWYFRQEQLPSALRVTPVDVRENNRPPQMRHGPHWEKVQESFRLCAQAGADLLAIESTGGKELHDEMLVNGDLKGIVFALGVLGVRDMEFLWKHIVAIARQYNIIASGDTACGFANTAMVLAEKKMIPRVLATLVRSASVVRSLVAFQQGAVGPTKDCAYEGPFIKAITGVPISMEGKSSACAHLSPLGNIAAACCDLWSNETVQNIRLLSASAPVVSLEQLIYDCRLMNAAISMGKSTALTLQKLFCRSDAAYDPQAYILQPEMVIAISKKIIQAGTPLQKTLAAVDMTLDILHSAVKQKTLLLPAMELRWLDMLTAQRETIADNESELLQDIIATSGEVKFDLKEYGL
jgi:methanol--5-hydroxybenzimidazolylcobamide Co-methyltransferase